MAKKPLYNAAVSFPYCLCIRFADAVAVCTVRERGSVISMNMDKKQYQKYAQARAPHSPVAKNCVKAFCIGGGICAFAQLLLWLYGDVCGMEKQNSATLVSVTLVALAVLLSGLGVFDNIAKHAGAGTLVPITGFANAVVSPALDAKSEGLVLGVGAKIFTVAGPVLLYGIVSGAVWGVIYYAITLFG